MKYRWYFPIVRRLVGEWVWAKAKAVRNWYYLLDRKRRIRLLKRLPRRQICAEVGVWKGEFSARILRRNRPKMLHLIDPWRFEPAFPNLWHGGSIAKSQDDMDRIYENVKTRLASARNVKIHRGTSADVLSQFHDDYFDWMYVDADHQYASVLADLRLCLAKTKPGGLIAGDDYTWGYDQEYPVRRAVEMFVKENGLSEGLSVLHSQYIIRLPEPKPMRQN